MVRSHNPVFIICNKVPTANGRTVPDYLLPGGKKPQDIGFVSLDKPKKRFVKGKGKKVVRGRNGKIDPLKTFNARGKGKK